jgi:hypothetical protein
MNVGDGLKVIVVINILVDDNCVQKYFEIFT